MKNPFPGMNPWLEGYWRDFHAKFLVYATDAVNEQLPPGLQARVDEWLSIASIEDDGAKLKVWVPDIAVTQSWDRVPAPVVARGGVIAAEPCVLDLEEGEVVQFIEIVDSKDHIITAVEMISPTNKTPARGPEEWTAKREAYLRAGINVVEIDLLRQGQWVLPPDLQLKRDPTARVSYCACITRSIRRTRIEYYRMPLRQRLPAIRIPLRAFDDDVALDLQGMVDQIFERGHYANLLDYAKPPPPPALPPEEQEWVKELLSRPA